MSKSIEDILDIDGSDGSFDDDEVRKAKERQEEREASAKLLRDRIKELKKKGNEEEYKREMLKLLGSEGMEVLIHMKHEIEDDPTARGAECYATLVSAITNTIGELEKIDNNERKNVIDLKKIAANTDNPGLIHGNNNVVMVGSTNDLLNMLEEGGIINSRGKQKIKTADVEAIRDDDANKTEDQTSITDKSSNK